MSNVGLGSKSRFTSVQTNEQQHQQLVVAEPIFSNNSNLKMRLDSDGVRRDERTRCCPPKGTRGKGKVLWTCQSFDSGLPCKGQILGTCQCFDSGLPVPSHSAENGKQRACQQVQLQQSIRATHVVGRTSRRREAVGCGIGGWLPGRCTLGLHGGQSGETRASVAHRCHGWWACRVGIQTLESGRHGAESIQFGIQLFRRWRPPDICEPRASRVSMLS